jgi:hypothetical protein
MGPTARFIGGAQGNFWNDHLRLTHDSMAEAVRLHGFGILKLLAHLLPYAMVNCRPFAMLGVSLFLQMPLF